MSNENFKSIQNTVVSQLTVNPVLNENLVLEKQALFTLDSTGYAFPVYFLAATGTPSICPAQLTLDQLSTAKNNADMIGLLVNPQVRNPTNGTFSALTQDGVLFLPATDTAASAITLLNLFSLNGQNGKQCLLKFSVLSTASDLNNPIVLRNQSSTGNFVALTKSMDSAGTNEAPLIEGGARGSYAYVVVTNTSTVDLLGNVNPKIEFRTIVESSCCTAVPTPP